MSYKFLGKSFRSIESAIRFVLEQNTSPVKFSMASDMQISTVNGKINHIWIHSTMWHSSVRLSADNTTGIQIYTWNEDLGWKISWNEPEFTKNYLAKLNK